MSEDLYRYYTKISEQVRKAKFKLDFFPKLDENPSGRNAAHVFKADQEKPEENLASSDDDEKGTKPKKKKKKEKKTTVEKKNYRDKTTRQQQTTK